MSEKPTPEEVALWQRRLADPATHYFAKAETVFFAQSAEPWERALAHAVAANVAAAKGDALAHREHFRKATEQTAVLQGPEERIILETTLRSLPGSVR